LTDGSEVFVTDRLRLVNGTEQHQVKSFPATASACKLRLKRVGPVVHYLVAEGDSEQFTDLHQIDIGTDDVHCIQIGGHTGGSQSGLDMRLLDFTVQAEELPGNPQARAQVAWGRSLLLGLEFFGVLLALSTAVWLSPHHARADKQSLLTPLAAPPPGREVTAIKEAPRGWLSKKWWLCGGLALIVPAMVCGWILWSGRPKPSSLLDITLGAQPVPGVKESGFSWQEYFKGLPIRWTDGDAQLVVPIDKTRPPQGLQVQLRAHRLPGVKRVKLQVVANGQSLFDGAIGLGDWEKTFDLRNIPLGDQLILSLKSDTFTPLGSTKLGGDGKEKSDDPRQLGVQVRGIKLLPDLPARQRDLSGRKIRALPPAPVSIAPLACGALSPDGKLVVAGARDGTIVFWDIAANRRRILPALSPNLLAIAISPIGNTFATASADRLIRLWDTASGQARATLAGHAGEITALAYSADGKTLVSVGGERFRAGELKLWNLQTGKEQVSVEPFKVRLWCVAVAPDGKTAAVGSGDGTAYLVDLKSGKIRMSFPNPAYIRRIALSPDGKWLAAGYGDKGQVRIHSLSDGKLRCELQVPGGTYMEGLHFTGDSRRLFTACGEGSAALWDFARTPAAVATLPKDQTGLLPFALLLPDGRSFVTAGDKGLMRLLGFPQDFAARAMIDFLRLVNPRGEHGR
jgi:WD40 repeat protein